MEKKTEVALIKESELSLIEDNALKGKQLALILKKTPSKYLKKRPAKGGGTWDYVSGSYVRKCLNLLFGWDWSFEVVKSEVLASQVIILGKLICNTNGKTITKMQYGKKDIMYKKGTETPLDLGNDFKAATTDALKKCASEIGIAGDVYGKEDFKEIEFEIEHKPKVEKIYDNG